MTMRNYGEYETMFVRSCFLFSQFEWLNALCVCHWRLNHHMSIDDVWSSCQSHEKSRIHTHTHNAFCRSVCAKGWRLFFVWCHWTSAVCFASFRSSRSIVQFIFNCYCHCCYLWIFRYTISQWSRLSANVTSVMSTRANNNVNDWERIKETIHLFFHLGLAWDNCFAQVHNSNFSIFALAVCGFSFGIGRETNLIYCHRTSTTNSDEPCIWQQSAALLAFIQATGRCERSVTKKSGKFEFFKRWRSQQNYYDDYMNDS